MYELLLHNSACCNMRSHIMHGEHHNMHTASLLASASSQKASERKTSLTTGLCASKQMFNCPVLNAQALRYQSMTSRQSCTQNQDTCLSCSPFQSCSAARTQVARHLLHSHFPTIQLPHSKGDRLSMILLALPEGFTAGKIPHTKCQQPGRVGPDSIHQRRQQRSKR